MQSILSIIVPVFNTKEYLSCCIDSILNQSFTQYDLLLVDDGSSDGSSDVCDQYGHKDSRIHIIHKENGGVSSARNVGLEKAKGEWVFFLDSDDLLPARALEMLMAHVDNDVDMVYGAIRKFNEIDDNLETIIVDKKHCFSVEEALDAFVVPSQRNGDWHRYLINRIYRKSTIIKNGLKFMTDIYYKEDGLFVAQYLCRCYQKVICIPDIVYLYRQVPNSAMGSLARTYNPRLLTNLDSHGCIYQELKRRGIRKEIIKRERNELFQNYVWISDVMRRAGVFTRENKFRLLKRVRENAGPVNTFYHLVVLRYCRKIKRKFL